MDWERVVVCLEMSRESKPEPEGSCAWRPLPSAPLLSDSEALLGWNETGAMASRSIVHFCYPRQVTAAGPPEQRPSCRKGLFSGHPCAVNSVLLVLWYVP